MGTAPMPSCSTDGGTRTARRWRRPFCRCAVCCRPRAAATGAAATSGRSTRCTSNLHPTAHRGGRSGHGAAEAARRRLRQIQDHPHPDVRESDERVVSCNSNLILQVASSASTARRLDTCSALPLRPGCGLLWLVGVVQVRPAPRPPAAPAPQSRSRKSRLCFLFIVFALWINGPYIIFCIHLRCV